MSRRYMTALIHKACKTDLDDVAATLSVVLHVKRRCSMKSTVDELRGELEELLRKLDMREQYRRLGIGVKEHGRTA